MSVLMFVINITVRHPVHVRENWRIFSTEMEFSKNVYAYVLIALSRNLFLLWVPLLARIASYQV